MTKLSVYAETRLFCSPADEQRLFGGERRIQKKLGAVIDNPVGAGLMEFGFTRGGAQRQDARACRFAGANSRGSVLNDNALARRYTEELRAFQIGLRVRLPMFHIGRRNQIPGLRQACCRNAHAGQRSRARGYDCPSFQGKRLKQLHGPGQRNDSLDVGDFAALHFTILGCMICAGEEFANGRNARPPVRLFYNFVGIESVRARPAGPDAGHRWCGIHQNSVQIEEYTAATNAGHDS